MFDGRRSALRQATETYNLAFNRLTEQRSMSASGRLCASSRSSWDIASHYQREIPSATQRFISEEMQLRFSSMQVDVFALWTEPATIAHCAPRSTTKREFYLAQSDLQTANQRAVRRALKIQPPLRPAASAANSGH